MWSVKIRDVVELGVKVEQGVIDQPEGLKELLERAFTTIEAVGPRDAEDKVDTFLREHPKGACEVLISGKLAYKVSGVKWVKVGTLKVEI